MSGPVLASSKGLQLSEPIGWPLMPVPDGEGRLRYPDLASSVHERLETILRTAPGEQLMRPTFGVGLERLIHQPNTLGLRNDLQDRIANHIAAFEPRILVDRIAVSEGRIETEIEITIAYRLRATNLASQITAQVPLGGAA